jgi:hypothetical protein
MHNNCVQVVGIGGDIFGKVANLCAVSTVRFLGANKPINYVHSLYSIFAHVRVSCTQCFLNYSPPYFYKFYPVSPGPINTTNLIKE